MYKQKVIKKIEELTGLQELTCHPMTIEINDAYYFENKDKTIYLSIWEDTFHAENLVDGNWCAFNIPTNWLKPLSILIPLLFKNIKIEDFDPEAEFFGDVFEALQQVFDNKELAKKWANTITADPAHERTEINNGPNQFDGLLKDKHV